MAEYDFNRDAKIIEHRRAPRPGLLEIIKIACGLSDIALAVTCGSACHIAGQNPRFPVKISVDMSGLNSITKEIIRIAEMASDEGLNEIINNALRAADEYPIRNAEIIKLKRPAARKNKRCST